MSERIKVFAILVCLAFKRKITIFDFQLGNSSIIIRAIELMTKNGIS